MRLLIIVPLFFTQAGFANSDWDEQDFVFDINVKSQQSDSKNIVDKSHEANLEASLVHLFDGLSSKALMSLSKQFFELESLSKFEKESYRAEFGLRYFLNEYSNFDVILNHYNQFELADPVRYRFYAEPPRIVAQEYNSVSVRFNLGNDQTLRKLTFSADFVDSNITDDLTDIRLRQWQTVQTKVRFDHRFTEDSHWSADTEIRSGDYGNFDSLSERTYVDLRAGFKTRYFGNSSISILAGVSNQDQSDLLESNAASWKIKNTLNVTENFTVELVSLRQFNYSDNPDFATSDQISSGLDFRYSFTEQLATTLSLESFRNEYSEQDWSEDNSVLIRANYLYNDHLLIFFRTKFAELKGNQTELNFDSKSASLGIKFELL